MEPYIGHGTVEYSTARHIPHLILSMVISIANGTGTGTGISVVRTQLMVAGSSVKPARKMTGGARFENAGWSEPHLNWFETTPRPECSIVGIPNHPRIEYRGKIFGQPAQLFQKSGAKLDKQRVDQNRIGSSRPSGGLVN
jgi:hypothetical protein